MLAQKMEIQCWKKLGVIFRVNENSEWMYQGASMPKALLLEDRIRVYFSTKDKDMRSRAAYFDVDISDPLTVTNVSNEPVLDIGLPGTHDDCGVNPSSMMWHDNKIFMYYQGWNALTITPHRLTTGLAVSEDGGNTFKRYSRAPLFDRTDKEPIFSNNPYVIKQGKDWHMYYLNLEEWVPVNGRFEGKFTLYYAHSFDGIHWDRDATVALERNYDLECISNASAIFEDGIFKMWYSYRSLDDFRVGSGAYLIGYAESRDAMKWQRMDNLVNLQRSENDWDSMMLAFPSVIDVGRKRYMFYNGNGFGKTGIGLACLDLGA
jgi:hypothetical protein